MSAPPLDLAALRKTAEAALRVSRKMDYRGDRNPPVSVKATSLLALLDRAEAAERAAGKAEREKADLFDIGIREKNRATTAEATIARIREAWGEYVAKLGGGIPPYYREQMEQALVGESITSTAKVIRTLTANVVETTAEGYGFSGCSDRNPDYCACGDSTPTCSLCDQEIEDGQLIHTINQPTNPYFDMLSMDQEWEETTWHVECPDPEDGDS